MVRPWPNFKEELEARMSKNPSYDLTHGDFINYNDVDVEKINPIFVSRMPNRKISGQAHEETVYSLKHNKDNGIVTVKKALNRISESEIKMILNNEECKTLYMSDKDTYDRIFKRMQEYNFKAEKAFSIDYVFRKTAKNGEGPIIRSIKVPSVMNAGVEVQEGLAANGGIARLDIFEKNNKFYMVPIYIADMINRKLPNKAIKAYKSENEWIEMDESYKFKFSIYSKDLIRVKKKKENDIWGYYTTMQRCTGSLNLLAHDGSEEYKSIGIQNLEIFEKYEVDILGNYHRVKKETRKGEKNNKK